MKPKYFGMMALASVLAVGASGAVLAGNVASEPVSEGGVTPYIIEGISGPNSQGGNRTCADVASAFDTTFKCGTDRVNYENGAFQGGFSDPSEECMSTALTVSTDGTYVTWSASPTPTEFAAIVKGSNEANVYYYPPPNVIGGDSGLASPPAGQSGGAAGLSNLTFCWNPGQGGEEPCWYGETAWAAGIRYVTKGNWATYTAYSGEAATVTLFAGQTLAAGSVAFSAPDMGQVTITVTLNTGWRFAPKPADYMGDYENLKVQDYANTPPAENPAPGLFAWKTECTSSPCTIQVPENNFYGVHSDVEQARPCPVEE